MKFPMTCKILAVCVALQIAQSFYPDMIDKQCLWSVNFKSLITLPLAFAQMLVHQFSHAGWWHLIGNFSFGLPFMAYLEHKLGGKKMLEFYVLCGVASACLFMVMPLTAPAMIGASGSLFGIATGACLMFAEDKTTKALAFIMICALLVPQLAALQLSFLLPGIAFAGHIGGSIGAMLAMSMGYKK